MITGDYEKLAEIAKNNLCSEHRSPLEVAWHSEANSNVLRCGQDHYPDAVVRRMSLTEEHKAGDLPDGPVKDNVVKGMKRRQESKFPMIPKSELSGVPVHDLATGELIGADMLQLLLDYAAGYHLDLMRGHAVIMYGKPYITLDGYLFHANRSGKPYSMESHPLDLDEYPKFQIPEGSHAWQTTVRFAGVGNYVTGLGIVTREEMTEESKKRPGQLASPVVARHPWLLAQKRAEWQALRRAFPIGNEGSESNEAGD